MATAEIVTPSALHTAFPLRNTLQEVRSTGIAPVDLWFGRVICDHVAHCAAAILGWAE